MATSDSNQSNTSVSKIDPTSGKHNLSYAYTFWYLSRSQPNESWEDRMKPIGTFHTVEDFWAYYSHLARPASADGLGDFHLFRDGVKPMWEDNANRNGGKWMIRVKRGMAARCWENLLLAFIGDTYQLGDELCGLVCSAKLTDPIISVWNKSAHNEENRNRVRDMIKKVLNLPGSAGLEYRFHDQSMLNAIKRQQKPPTAQSPSGAPQAANRDVPAQTLSTLSEERVSGPS